MNAKAVQNATVRASIRATKEEKIRARAADISLTQACSEGFYFNAFLNLLYRGAAPTEANILAESKLLIAADEQRMKERQGAHEARGAARRAAA